MLGARSEPPHTIAPVTEPSVILNLQAIRRRPLIAAARSLATEEPHGSALIVAQAAVESGVETAISFALQIREVPEPLQEWIGHRSTLADWSPTNDRVQRLWTAMTSGDRIVEAPGWQAYVEGVKLRHAFAHRAAMVTHEQAVSFIDAAEQVLDHVVNVIDAIGDGDEAAFVEEMNRRSIPK
jgi:hypothetical protein